MAGLAPSGFDAALTQTDRDYVNDPRWLAWWDSLGVGDEVFAVICVEDRQKTTHRVTKSKKGITIGLGVPAQDARAARKMPVSYGFYAINKCTTISGVKKLVYRYNSMHAEKVAIPKGGYAGVYGKDVSSYDGYYGYRDAV